MYRNHMVIALGAEIDINKSNSWCKSWRVYRYREHISAQWRWYTGCWSQRRSNWREQQKVRNQQQDEGVHPPVTKTKMRVSTQLSQTSSKMRVSTPPLLVQHWTWSLVRAVSHEKEIKRIQLGKEEVKVSLFSDDMILYIKDSKDSTRKLQSW